MYYDKCAKLNWRFLVHIKAVFSAKLAISCYRLDKIKILFKKSKKIVDIDSLLKYIISEIKKFDEIDETHELFEILKYILPFLTKKCVFTNCRILEIDEHYDKIKHTHPSTTYISKGEQVFVVIARKIMTKNLFGKKSYKILSTYAEHLSIYAFEQIIDCVLSSMYHQLIPIYLDANNTKIVAKLVLKMDGMKISFFYYILRGVCLCYDYECLHKIMNTSHFEKLIPINTDPLICFFQSFMSFSYAEYDIDKKNAVNLMAIKIIDKYFATDIENIGKNMFYIAMKNCYVTTDEAFVFNYILSKMDTTFLKKIYKQLNNIINLRKRSYFYYADDLETYSGEHIIAYLVKKELKSRVSGFFQKLIM